MNTIDFVKYAADNHIKFTLPEDNRKFPGQQCQDEKLNEAFRSLHTKLVNQIISFCKENNIIIDEFQLNADCLEKSIIAGSWQACTDSCFSFKKFSDDYNRAFIQMDKEFLSKKSKKDLDNIVLNQENYLLSI